MAIVAQRMTGVLSSAALESPWTKETTMPRAAASEEAEAEETREAEEEATSLYARWRWPRGDRLHPS